MDNPRIIHAPINIGRRYGITSPITQYDYGYLLLPEGVELPTIYEIDFSNDEKHGTSFTVYGNSEGAEVPEVLIRTGKDVFAFYYEVGEGYGKTEYTWRIPNNCRPIRDGQTPTPTQQSSIDQLIVRSNEAVESAEQSASDASQSAQTAQGYAEQAETARDTAQTYANNAQTSANNASASASQASASASASAQSASQSAQIKSDVEDMVDDAQGYAESASQSASASAQSASDAHGYAQSASASAQSASQYASSAQTSANTASAKAHDASESAQTASTKATESAQSASQALTYKTDAESAKTASQTAQGLAEGARDSAISAKNDAESARDDAESARDEAQQAVASIADALDDKAPVITDTASGAIASFSDGADDLPLKSLIVDINPIQDLSQGDPSPTNICPISGWTQVDVNHSDADMTNPTTLTIQLGQTVYGGKLDVLSGILTVDKAMQELDDSGTINMGHAGSGDAAFRYFQWGNDYAVDTNAWETDVIANFLVTNTGGRGARVQYNAVKCPRIIVPESGSLFETVEDVKAYLNETHLTIVYPLATPITIQLTPNQINSLLGVNNIWADSGDTEAVYRADTKLFIERLTAPDSADMLADANITSGQYFMVGNSLYKATANIANGGQIIVGTNATRVSLAQALNEINA